MKLSRYLAVFVLALSGTLACGDDGSDSDDSGSGGSSGAGAGTSGRSGSGGGGRGSGGSSGSSGRGGTQSTGGSSGAGESSGGQNMAGDGGTGHAGSTVGGEAGESGGQGGGGEGGGGEPVGTPLLERTPRIAYDCSVTRPVTLLALNPWGGSALLPTDDVPHLIRSQGGYGQDIEVRWSTIGMNGTLGAPKTIHDAGNQFLDRLTVAAHGDRYSVFWSQTRTNSNNQLMFAEIDDEGATLTPAVPLPFGGTQPTNARAVASGAGQALVWLDQPAQLMSQLKFVLVDEAGDAAGTPHVLAEGGGALTPLAFTKMGDGFLLVYSHLDYAQDLQATYVLALDAAGQPRRAAVKLDGGLGGASILPRGDRALVAWSVAEGGFELSGRSEAIRVGWFAADGDPVGPSYALQAQKIDEENTFPTWVDFGDDVGLVWSKGSIIYICAGCVPDHHLKFIILDGDDLTPKSALLDLPSPNAFGLLRAQALRQEDDVLITVDVTRHVDAEGASAKVTCPASP